MIKNKKRIDYFNHQLKKYCPDCNGDVQVSTSIDKDSGKTFVSHGSCVDCFKQILLKRQEFNEFIREKGITNS